MAQSSLLIQGIEVTQAIQYYRSHMHLADPQDRAPDNAARLVAGKPAWVRVYVRSSGDALHDVTGSLRVERYAPESLLAELNPEPPGSVIALHEPEATGSPLLTPATFYRWERSNLAATLNFVIPSSLMCGNLRLTARVSAADGQTQERVTLLNVTLRQSIRFRAIMLGSITQDALGNLVIVNPPTLADLQTTSALTLQMFPVAANAVYEIAATRYLSFPLGGNGCDGDKGWNQLQKVLDAAATADGNQQGCIYYGLIASGVTGGGGCNWSTVAAGFAGQPVVELVMAHEIGHYFQAHAPCGNPDGVDPSYPTYEPYDPASIGEYGLNVNTGEVMSPETYKDIMAYCKPNQWVSLYGHKRRINQPLLNPESVCLPRIDRFYPPKVPIDVTFPFVAAKPRPVVTILGTQDILGNVTVDDVFRSASYAGQPGVATTLVAVLEGADGQLLASGAMTRIAQMQCGQPDCGCRDRAARGPWSIKGVLPDVAAGALLRILKDGQEVWRRVAPPAAPRIDDVSAEVIEGERLIVRWRGSGSGELQYWGQWSSDGGDTWNGLATGITGSEVNVSLEALPAGRIGLRIVAHDGFFSVPSDPVTVTIPARPPVITILHPRQGAILPAGRTVRLWAAVTTLGQELGRDTLTWFVDDREVGRGLESWIVAPDPGEHRCTLRVREREETERRVTFNTEPPPETRPVPW